MIRVKFNALNSKIDGKVSFSDAFFMHENSKHLKFFFDVSIRF
jgi:hypothetical protein